MTDNPNLSQFLDRLEKLSDETRTEAKNKRHKLGLRTARENLDHLVDNKSFLEYGAFAVAAQRNRRKYEDLQIDTAADGIITGFCKINSDLIGEEKSDAVSIVYDYSVLAGTQGFFHHMKLDRICEKAKEFKLPIVIYTEGGGGRPGDTDVTTSVAGLHVPSFALWASLYGFCFAGNAALFGSADIRIATKNSWIGMAGPAMIEGGGLGKFDPKEIGPSDIQKNNGVIDYVAEDEKEATIIAKKILSYFQGDIKDWKADDQTQLSNIMPKDRRWSYPVRDIIKIISDIEEFTEIKPEYGKGIVTCFIRIEGKPFGLLANDSQHLGGAIDSEGADKATSFIELCSEYGLGAQAMVGGSLHEPVYTAAWPTGEFGAMGLEGAVKLGFKKELEKIEDNSKREELFNSLVEKLYDKGKAIEAAAHLEIDAVINPSETRSVILKSQKAFV